MSWAPEQIFALCLASFTLLAWPAAAQAQQACAERGLDAFDAARRARRVIQDYAALHGVLQRDLDALSTGRAIFGMKPLKRRYFVSPIVERSRWYDLPTCDEGQLRSASLLGLRYGLVAGAELNDLNLRLDGFWINSSDTLDITRPARDGGERTLSQGQSMVGASARLTRWAALTLGVISDDRSPDPNEPDAASSRLYLALGVPALNLQAELILDQRDQSLQTLYIDLNRLRLTDAGLALTARARAIWKTRRRSSPRWASASRWACGTSPTPSLSGSTIERSLPRSSMSPRRSTPR